METIVFIILQIFYATRVVLKIGYIIGYPPVLAGGYSVTWALSFNFAAVGGLVRYFTNFHFES